MTVVWHTILERFNVTSLSLQKVDIDLISAVKLYDSLVTFLLQLRDRLDEKEEKAKSYVEIQEYKEATKRTERRKRFFDESTPVHQIYRTNCTRSVPYRGLSRCGTSQASGCILHILRCTNCLVF